METSFNVQQVLFETNDSEVLLQGTTIKGVMHYESQLILTHTQLNQVLNLLQRQNAECDIHSCVKSEPMYNGETLYSGYFAELPNATIDLSLIATNYPMKQIRA